MYLILIHRNSGNSRTFFSADQFPSQDVIDELTPIHRPLFNSQTREQLLHYLREVRQKLDHGVPLNGIPQFTSGKVLICGGLFPSDQYPSQDTIDRLTPEPMNGRELDPWRLEELAAYFKEVKETVDRGGEIYDVPLRWPPLLKGENWCGERHG